MSVIDNKLLQEAIHLYETDDMNAAIPMFMELAENHNEEAFLYLSLIYRDGDGVEKDEFKAKLYKKKYVDEVERKAINGDVNFKLKLADIYQYGDGVPIDEDKAYDILLKLANEDVAEAQFRLYSIFTHGWCGKKIDKEKALRWLDKATELEWPEALCTTAIMWLDDSNSSVEIINEAENLLRKSLKLGHWPAEAVIERYFSN